MQREIDDIAAIIPDMDGKVGRRLIALMDEKGVSGGDIARLLGVSRTAVSAWRRGAVANMKAVYILRLAQYFNVNPRWLETGFGPKEGSNPISEVPDRRYIPHTEPTPLRSVPVLKWDQASSYRGGPVVGAGETIQVAAEVGPMAFAIRQQGDAMEPRIADGAVVIIDPAAEYAHGSVILAKRPTDPLAVLRLLWYDGGIPSLRALNPAYPMLDMPSNTVVIGKAVVVQMAL